MKEGLPEKENLNTTVCLFKFHTLSEIELKKHFKYELFSLTLVWKNLVQLQGC